MRAATTRVGIFGQLGLALLMCSVGIALRGAMGSVPPLVESMREPLDLTPVTIGMLTSVAAFGLGLSAPLGQRVVRWIGPYHALTVALLLVGAAGVVRGAVDGLSAMMVTVVLAAIGSGLGSVAVPGLIATHLPAVRDAALGLYASGLALGMAVTAAVAVPSADLLGGWRVALAVWGWFALVVMVLWWPVGRSWRRQPAPRSVTSRGMPWRSPDALVLTAFCSCQMLLMMTGTAWIAPMYADLGRSPASAAHLLTIFQSTQIVGLALVPLVASRLTDRRPLLLVCAGMVGTAHALVLAAPLSLAGAYVTLFGLAMGGTAAVGLLLVVDMAEDAYGAAALGALVLLCAFSFGGIGPLAFGVLRDLTGDYFAGNMVMVALSALLVPLLRELRPGRALLLKDIRDKQPSKNSI